MEGDAQLAFQLKRLKKVPSMFIRMPTRKRGLPALPHKTRLQEQGRYGKKSPVLNGRPQETMLQGTGILTSGEAGNRNGLSLKQGICMWSITKSLDQQYRPRTGSISQQEGP